MPTTKLLFDTFRFAVIRRNDWSIEIAPKGDPKGTGFPPACEAL